MNLKKKRAAQVLELAAQSNIVVIGDMMLDQFIWGDVNRISPEAPVPVVDFVRESFMPGGAANVARNLAELGVKTSLLGAVGKDEWGRHLKTLLAGQNVDCSGLVELRHRPTSVKTRVVAHQQQLVRIDRESRGSLDDPSIAALLSEIRDKIAQIDAIIVCDYGKGVVTQSLLDGLKGICRESATWLSLDPKPVHRLELTGLSLITPNRKEAFELAGIPDSERNCDPLKDDRLMEVAESLLEKLNPALLLITLGDLGMLLCQRKQKPFHIPTVAQEVFDVSGAGDTVIASFTMAIAAGASPVEAAIISNHAAGVVVGKVGTATVQPAELLASLKS